MCVLRAHTCVCVCVCIVYVCVCVCMYVCVCAVYYKSVCAVRVQCMPLCKRKEDQIEQFGKFGLCICVSLVKAAAGGGGGGGGLCRRQCEMLLALFAGKA